jgi:hypothetical protein
MPRQVTLRDNADAPIYMVIPKQLEVPVGIPREGKDQFEIAQVAVRMEEAVRIIIGECCTWLRTNRSQDSGGKLGQKHVPQLCIINGID